ncbi:MAG: hypothetical protein ABIZ56_02820 [Chthoniobacteraceae bacterium]
MKNLLSPLVLAVCGVAFLSTPASAQVPQLVNDQSHGTVATARKKG